MSKNQKLEEKYNVIAAAFIGGTEKIKSEQELKNYGIKVIKKENMYKTVKYLLKIFDLQEIIDLSDEPIVGYKERFKLASIILSCGVDYSGADFKFKAPDKSILINRPSISVIGTGKRIGKTAIGGYIARILSEKYNPILFTMGRGGPKNPEVIKGKEIEMSPNYLMSINNKGRHASSDHFEDALTSKVTTIGCRRCGGGMSGQVFSSNVKKGIELLENIEGDIVIFEGSGTTMPPIKTDLQILVVGAHQPLEYIKSYFGPYKIYTSDLIILTMCELPLADNVKVVL